MAKIWRGDNPWSRIQCRARRRDGERCHAMLYANEVEKWGQRCRSHKDDPALCWRWTRDGWQEETKGDER